MGKKYFPLDRIQVEDVLKKLGFIEKPQKATSHAQWEGYVKEKRRVVTVDHFSSKKEKYGKRLLGKMLEQAGLTKKEFYSYL